MEKKNIVELRTLRKENRGLMQYIFFLRQRGVIGDYVSEDGYAAYCPEEVEEYKRRVKHGRPMNKKAGTRFDETEDMLQGIFSDIQKIKKGE